MKKFYPVVHIHNLPQVLINVELAKNAGADGVFLIDHYGRPPKFLVKEIVSSFQDDTFSIGINYLMRSSKNAWALNGAKAIGCKMFWSDDAGTDADNYEAYGNQILELQEESDIDFFGGIHFKYQQKPNRTLSASLKRAFPYIKYPTLSGTGTGIPADLEYIKEAAQTWQDEQESISHLKNVIFPRTVGLAIASGVSINNVDSYLPYIDAFLVASSIIDPLSSDERFDQRKLELLCKKIKIYKS